MVVLPLPVGAKTPGTQVKPCGSVAAERLDIPAARAGKTRRLSVKVVIKNSPGNTVIPASGWIPVVSGIFQICLGNIQVERAFA